MANSCDTTGSESLREELSVYERERGKLIREHEGKFVLIKGNELVGIYDTQQDAYSAGLERFGNQPFLIKQISLDEPTQNIPAFFLGLIDAHA